MLLGHRFARSIGVRRADCREVLVALVPRRILLFLRLLVHIEAFGGGPSRVLLLLI